MRDLEHTANLFAFAREHIGAPSQDPDEFRPFLAWVSEIGPRVTMEIGTENAGTGFLLAHALPTVEVHVAMDLRIWNKRRLRQIHRPTVTIETIEGDSHAQRTRERLVSILAGRPIDLLFIDGDHSFAGVAQDFWDYRELVRPGGVIAFHDIVPDGRLRSGIPSAGAYAGEVAAFWHLLRGQFESHEFVSSWKQWGRGIGAIINDPAVRFELVPTTDRAEAHTFASRMRGVESRSAQQTLLTLAREPT